jgi:hypothetical protein
MNLKEIGKLFASKFVGTGPSSYKKNYRAAVSQRLRNTSLHDKMSHYLFIYYKKTHISSTVHHKAVYVQKSHEFSNFCVVI